MQARIHIDRVHARAILFEVGERLRSIVPMDQSKLPAQIEERLNRLREQDSDDSLTIVPSLEH